MRCKVSSPLPLLYVFISSLALCFALRAPIQQPFGYAVDAALGGVDPLLAIPLSRSFAHQSRLSSVVMSDGAVTTTSDAGPKPDRGFEINRPTRILPDGDHVRSSTKTLMQHSFANSYGQPAIMTYSPDRLDDAFNDPSKWVFIEIGLEGYAKGRQFDRLGSVQLDGVEVLRTDNQEPSANGTSWSFTKEMNKYFDLFRTERTLLFDFPNIVNEVYTAPLNMTLTFTAYIAANEQCTLPVLSKDYPTILPLSKQDLKANSFFTLGDDYEDKPNDVGVTRLKMPKNARSALVEIYASGTAKDEFWYTNLPNDDYDRISGATANVAYPRGPLRELQVLIDGQLAGIALPFPVIFTGGISPFLWRPQVAFGAFDQPTYLIDVTPFLGSLTDEKEHEFALKVVSAEQNQTVLSWFISGNVQVQLDPSGKRTTGQVVRHEAPLSGQYSHESAVHGNITQGGSIHAQLRSDRPRTILIEATLQPGSSSEPYTVTWSQSMSFSTVNELQNETSSTIQSTTGTVSSLHGTQRFLSYHFSFPLNLTGIGSNYTLEHGYHVELSVSASAGTTYKEPQSQKIDLTQNGEAYSIIGDDPQRLLGGYGSTLTSYHYEDSNGRTFSRNNRVANQTITDDDVHGTLASKAGVLE